MAQGQIRKGFFFYFGLLMLFLVAVFLILVVVMMFNPGKTILWMQYFTPEKEHFYVEKTTDTDAKINYDAVSEIEINCSYADVTIEKSARFKDNGLHIINKAKGFTVAETAKKFDYKVTMQGTKLVVDITEPTGFVYLSANVEVVLCGYTTSSFDLSSKSIVVNGTDDCNVRIGTYESAGSDIALRAIDVKTKKGNISFGKKVDFSKFQSVKLHTESGKINSAKNVSRGDVSGMGIDLSCAATLSTKSGKIDLPNIFVNGQLELVCDTGVIVSDNIISPNTNVRCKEGNYLLGKVDGHLSYENSESSIIAPNINVGTVTGNFALATNSANTNVDPKIKISKVGGKVVISANKGELDIDECGGDVEIANQDSFKIDLVFSSGVHNAIIKSKNSGVRVGFKNTFSGLYQISSENGKVSVDFDDEATFTATCYKYGKVEAGELNNNISVNFGSSVSSTKNPLKPNGGSESAKIVIDTNASVDYRLR